MKILVVDDEPLARQRLATQLGDLDIGTEVREAENGLDALSRLENFAAEIVLLDIRMPGMDGLETARHLALMEPVPAVIFTTAYDEHALAAFEAQAVAYLLKPVRREKLADAIERARALRAGHEAIAVAVGDELGTRTHVSAMVGGNLNLMPLSAVCYFQADQGYVSAVAPDSRLLIEDSLRSLEQEFGDDFVRVHRNALVNVRHVDSLRKDAGGNIAVVFKQLEEQLLVSRRLVAGVRKRLQQS